MVQGRGINSEINETGRTQAQKFYQAYKDHPFDIVYTSNLKRTQQSVQEFLDMGYPTQALAGFDEISWGDHEGMAYDMERHQAYLDGLAQWTKGNLDHRVGGGETPLEVKARQEKAMKIVLSGEEENILIATHGRAMRILICWLMGRDLSEAEYYKHSNLCVYQLKYEGGEFEILKEADTSHMD